MPELVALVIEHPPVVGRQRVALGVHVGEIGDLRGHARVLRDAARGLLQRAEAAGEGYLLVVGQVLIVKDQHGVLLEGGADLDERGIVDVAQVGAHDLGREMRVQLADGDAHRVMPPAWGSPTGGMIGAARPATQLTTERPSHHGMK